MTVDFWRNDWGAPPNTAPSIPTPTDLLFLHHTVTPKWRGADAARRIERIARGRGFSNGYSYSAGVTVAPDSHEGRGGGRAGAHTAGYNRRSHAIVLVGNFDTSPVPDKLVEEAAQLVAFGHRQGWWPDHITHPHRAVSSTACPGRYGVAAIPKINARAAQILRGDTEPEEDELSFLDENEKEWLDQFVKASRGAGMQPNSFRFWHRVMLAVRRQTTAHHGDLEAGDADSLGVRIADGSNSGHRVKQVTEEKGFGLAEFVGKAVDLVRRSE